MNAFDDLLNPDQRLQASQHFADGVMARIYQQEEVIEAPVSMGKKILGMAAMVLICVTIGISIGSSPDWSWQKDQQKHSLKEFQDSHYLFPDRKESILMFEI